MLVKTGVEVVMYRWNKCQSANRGHFKMCLLYIALRKKPNKPKL